MTTIPMPEPVAWVSHVTLKTLSRGRSVTASPEETPWRAHGLITTTQAEAYADARVAESQQWNPIETAPKDGTWILAINAAKNPGRQHVVHYSERWGNHYPWVTGSAPMDFVAGVTHWMPLPAPPLPGPVEP